MLPEEATKIAKERGSPLHPEVLSIKCNQDARVLWLESSCDFLWIDCMARLLLFGDEAKYLGRLKIPGSALR